MTLKHAQMELKTKQAEVKKMDSGYKKDQESLQAVIKNKEKLEAELAKLNYEGSERARPASIFPFVHHPIITVRMSVSMQMGRRKICWPKDSSCPERLPNLRRPMIVLCLVSPTCASTTSKDLC